MAEPFKGFDEMKQRYPAAEYIEIEIPLTGQPSSLLSTISPYMGKLNSTEFRNHPAETLLFMGPKASSGDSNAKLGFVSRPEGWNTPQHPEMRDWGRNRSKSDRTGPLSVGGFQRIKKSDTHQIRSKKSDTHQIRSRSQTPTKFVRGSRTPGSQTPTPGSQTPAKFVREFARDAGGCHAGSRRWRRDDPRASGRCGQKLVGGPGRF
jgi:hypothetical protein